jgi:hypothetical protein
MSGDAFTARQNLRWLRRFVFGGGIVIFDSRFCAFRNLGRRTMWNRQQSLRCTGEPGPGAHQRLRR